MQEILALAVPVLFIFLFIKILLTPMKLIFKLLLNTGCGFICLFLLNLLSGTTGIVFELNFITAACRALFCSWWCSTCSEISACYAAASPDCFSAGTLPHVIGSRQGPMDQERSIG